MQSSDAKVVGRPKLPFGKAKTVSLPIWTTPGLREKANRLSKASGLSRNAWIESLIKKAEV